MTGYAVFLRNFHRERIIPIPSIRILRSFLYPSLFERINFPENCTTSIHSSNWRRNRATLSEIETRRVFLPPKKSELMKRGIDASWVESGIEQGRCLSWKRSDACKHAQPCVQGRCMCIRVIDDARRRATGPLVK